MKAEQRMVIEFLNGNKQQLTPFYQRKYRWSKPNCERLFEDIIKIGKSKVKHTYFLGVIFHGKPYLNNTAISHYDIIDGQQRVTTLTLFICALAEYLKKNPIDDLPNYLDLIEDYVINRNYSEDDYFKLKLQEKDDNVFKNLIFHLVNDDVLQNTKGSRVLLNFNYFKNKINSKNIHTLYKGFLKLKIMDMILEEDDNPQEVFETINSTGLNLRQSEQVKNYLFMGLSNKNTQKRLDSLYSSCKDCYYQCSGHCDLFDDILPFEKTCFMYKNKAEEIHKPSLTGNRNMDRLVAKSLVNIIEEHNKRMERLSSKS